MEVQSKGSQSLLQTLSSWAHWLLRLINLRLAVVIGISAFLMAAGVDSSGNYATVADLQQTSVQVMHTASNPAQSQLQGNQAKSSAKEEVNYLEFDPAIANRLRQGDITRASLISSRLTKAHFFTDSFRVSPH